MKWIVLIISALAGTVIASFFLLMQHWTVNKINPHRIKQSMRLVIGGAILRWILFSLLLIFALQQSLAATLIAFIAFMITRTLLLASISRFSLVWSGNKHLN